MPKKAKAAEPETKTTEAPKGTKSAAIKAALKANPRKTNQEISELLKAEGWDAKPTYISVVKSNTKRKKKAKAAPVPEAAAPAVPKDAVSIALMQKAKKLAKDLGGIKAAKQAIDALCQLMD